MRKSLNDTLWRTRQGDRTTSPGGGDGCSPSAPLVPEQIDYAALGNAPPKDLGALSLRAQHLRSMRRPLLGACVTAGIIGGKA